MFCACGVGSGNGLTSGLVSLEKAVDEAGVFATGALGFTDTVGVITKLLQINHSISLMVLGLSSFNRSKSKQVRYRNSTGIIISSGPHAAAHAANIRRSLLVNDP